MKSTINMVWHIFKKDRRLLWPFILGAAGIQFASAGVQYWMDHNSVPEESPLFVIFRLLGEATSLAVAFLIAAAVYQDAIPGVRQDWLVRPVRRRDLLLAKLLFILVMVQGPILLADTIQSLVNGFSLTQSLAAAVTRGLLLLTSISLPALAFASLTRNMTDAVVGGVMVFVGVTVLTQILAIRRALQSPTQGTGLQWVAHSALFAMLLLGAGAILAVQYFRRKTVFARWLTVGVVSLAFLAQFVPWQFAFAVQQRLSPVPGSGRPIVATYEPSLGKFRLPEGVSRNAVFQGSQRGARDEASTVYLPMHVAGLPDDGMLNADRSEVRLLAADGKVLYRGPGDDLLIRKEGHQGPVHFTFGSRNFGFVRGVATKDLSVPQDGEAWIYQGVALPRGLYEHIKNQPLHVEIDYSLTLLQGASYAIPALGGDQRIPGMGHCTTKMDDDGDDIDLQCMQLGVAPSCGMAFLEHVPSGRRNPAAISCQPYYAPYWDNLGRDAIVRFGIGIRYHDLSGLAKYPVDASQLPESRVVIRPYQPQDHFTRRLVIPNIRLSDWESVEK